MIIQKIETSKAPKAIGCYSQGVKMEDLIFTSGQIPINPITGLIVAGGIKEQTRQVLENLREVLIAGGADLSKVLKATVYIKDMNDFSDINDIYSTYFEMPYPARSCVEVARLPKDVLIEIEAIATTL